MATIVTARELGQYLKLSESTIYKLAATGELPGFKIGDSWRFDMDEIPKLIQDAKKTAQKELDIQKEGNGRREINGANGKRFIRP
jgi:excisionase family DNA binding protein